MGPSKSNDSVLLHPDRQCIKCGRIERPENECPPSGWPESYKPEPVLRDELRFDESRDTALGQIMARLAPK